MERAVLEYMVNSVWQVPLLAGMAWLAIRWARPEARVQYRLWIMTLVLSVALPIVAPGIFPARIHVENVASGAAKTQPLQVPVVTNSIQKQPSDRVAALNERPHTRPWLPMPAIPLGRAAMGWLIGIYLSVLLLRLSQLAQARRSANTLLRRARQTKVSAFEQKVLQPCCERLRVREPRVLISREVWTPMTMGAMRPAVLLPETFHSSTKSEMTAVLCHELAHVRRRDCLVNWACQLVSVPIAYHPASHAVHRRIRRTRELACDAMAAQAMDSSVSYARCLVTLAQRMRTGDSIESVVQAAGFFDHNVLEERIMRLLEKKSSVSLRVKIARTTGAIALIFGVTIAAAVFHVTPIVRAAQANAGTIEAQNATATAVPARTERVVPVAPPAPVAVHVQVPSPPRIPVPVATAPHPVAPAPSVRISPIAPIEIATPLRVPAIASVRLADLARQRAPAVLPVPVQPTAPTAVPRAPTKPSAIHAKPLPQSDRNGAAINEKEDFRLTPAEQARIDREMAAATAQIQEETKKLQSPEFKRQMARMQRQMAEATKQLQSAEVQRQMKILQSPEFQQKMAEMQRQMAEATKQLQSAEVQRQMKILQSPEFQQKMVEMQRKIRAAARQMENDSMQMKRQTQRSNR